MSACLCLFKVKPGSARYNVFLEFQIIFQNLFKVKNLRLIVDKSKHYNAEGFLHLRIFVEMIENNIGVCVFFNLNNYSHASAVGFIAQILYSLNSLFMHKLGNFFNKAGLIDLIRKLGYDNSLLFALFSLNFGACAHQNFSAPCVICRSYAASSHYYSGCRKIGSLYIIYKLVN